MDNLKQHELGIMTNIEKWTEVTKGLYRFVCASNFCYEIHLLYWYHDTDILTAKASLFIVGDWADKSHASYFERECLLSEQPLFECLEAAQKDYKENCE